MRARQLIERLEAEARLPAGSDERFTGYGVMGLPFRSGHVLVMRRFPATSVGPGYTSVWHRAPDGDWVFYTTGMPSLGCPRYFGAIARDSVETPIGIDWLADDRIGIRVPAVALDWEITIRPTAGTRFMNAMGSLLPGAAWRNGAVLTAMSAVAGPLLGAGRVGLQGTVPNGQHFVANPKRLWAIVATRACVAGEDVGPAGPVQPQAHLGDFWIPQRGFLGVGQAYFEAFDPARHSPNVVRPRA